VGAVVVGFDRHINYFKIQTAQLCISENPGCLFLATNLDAKTHLTDAQEWAGNGAMVGAIKGARARSWARAPAAGRAAAGARGDTLAGHRVLGAVATEAAGSSWRSVLPCPWAAPLLPPS